MKYRFVDKFKTEVSEVGFGAWQLGGQGTWSHMTEEEGIKLVHEALDKGVTLFDTAPNYANGNSEIILGKALAGKRKKVFINTKVGHGPDGAWEFSPEGIRNSVKRSLERLNTTYIDSVILHNPAKNILAGKNELITTLKKLKKEGLIKGYGVSVDTLEELDLVLDNHNVDTIEVMFNIIHQEPRLIFDRIKERGILLIIKVPLDSGWLTGKYDSKSTFTGIRERWSSEDIYVRAKIVTKIKDIFKKKDIITKESLAYILSYDEVSSIIPGIKNSEQLEENVKSSEIELDVKTKTELEKLYSQYIQHQKTPW